MTKILCCRGCQMNQVMPNGVFCTRQLEMGLSQLTFIRDVMESHQPLLWSKAVRISLVGMQPNRGPRVSKWYDSSVGISRETEVATIKKYPTFDTFSVLIFVITALFTNMRILKFKSQQTISFFAAVNHSNGPLRKQNFALTGSKGHGLWLVDFDRFCVFLCFKARCSWS